MMNRELMTKYETFLTNEFEKIISKGDMTPTEVSNLETGMCLLEKLKKHIQGDEQEASYRYEAYEPSYNGAQSYAPNHMRNSYGGESWGGSYNDGLNNSYGHYEQNGNVEDKIRSLESMRNETTNETERRMIDEWIQRLRTQHH